MAIQVRAQKQSRKIPFYRLIILLFCALNGIALLVHSKPQLDTMIYTTPEDMSISEIRSQPSSNWQNVSGASRVITGEYRHHWLRLNLLSKESSGQWSIANSFFFQDSISFYVFDSDGKQIPVNTTLNGIIPEGSFILPEGKELTLYVEIYSIGIALLDIYVLPEKDFYMWKLGQTMFLGIFLGFIVFLLGAGLLSLKSNLNRTVFYYLAYVMTSAVSLLMTTGHFNALLGGAWLHSSLVQQVYWCLGTLTFWLNIKFLQSLLPTRNPLNISKWLLWYSLVLCLVITIVPIEVAITLGTCNLVFTSVLAIIIIWPYRNDPESSYIGMGYCGLVTCIGLYLLSIDGYIPFNFISEKGMQIGFLWEVICFSITLAKRTASESRERQRIEDIITQQSYTRASYLTASDNYSQDNYHELTIMFIDIANFSISSAQLGIEKSFEKLSSWSGKIHTIIKENGGHIDRSLGDGILCFFGYNMEDPREHAAAAMSAAIAMQKMTVNKLAISSRTPYFPLRIGIHTSRVILGNLGRQGQHDYTMIGEGVIYASRLEAACNTFKISLSEETRKHLSEKNYCSEGFSRIYLKVKHAFGFSRAYEYDPFLNSKDTLIRAEKNQYIQLEKCVRKPRYGVSSSLFLISDIAAFKVLDFSEDGFGTISDDFVSSNTLVQVILTTTNDQVERKLKNMLLLKFNIQVKWSRRSGAGYKHGLKISGLTSEQKDFLLHCLHAV